MCLLTHINSRVKGYVEGVWPFMSNKTFKDTSFDVLFEGIIPHEMKHYSTIKVYLVQEFLISWLGFVTLCIGKSTV